VASVRKKFGKSGCQTTAMSENFISAVAATATTTTFYYRLIFV